MSLTVSQCCRRITPSATLAIDARAKALKARGARVIGLAAGEPDFQTPDYICDAAREALAKGFTRYTPASGTPELKEAVCAKFARDNGLVYTPEQVIISNGAKQALLGAFMAILDPGDEVLLPAPYWVSYPEMIRMAGGVPVSVPTGPESSFLPTVSQLAARLTPRTKAVLINSPSNPTGCVYPESLLAEIAAFAVEHALFIISDEIYEKLVYDGRVHVSVAALGERAYAQTIVVNGLSKTYAMTGWRVGYAAGPREVVAAMAAYQSHATSNPNSIAQYAAVEALRNGEDFIRAMRETFDARRLLMTERIAQIDGVSCVRPEGAFYVMLDCSALLARTFRGAPIGDTLTLSALLLEEAKVAVVPGAPFEAPAFCRLSYATGRQEILDGLDAIEAFVDRLGA